MMMQTVPFQYYLPNCLLYLVHCESVIKSETTRFGIKEKTTAVEGDVLGHNNASMVIASECKGCELRN